MIRKSNFWYWTLFRPKYWASSPGLKRKTAKVDINSQVENLNLMRIVPSSTLSLPKILRTAGLIYYSYQSYQITSCLAKGQGRPLSAFSVPDLNTFVIFLDANFMPGRDSR